jgi:hypothetical protein
MGGGTLSNAGTINGNVNLGYAPYGSAATRAPISPMAAR